VLFKRLTSAAALEATDVNCWNVFARRGTNLLLLIVNYFFFSSPIRLSSTIRDYYLDVRGSKSVCNKIGRRGPRPDMC
jgi:hypothetical protein